MNSFKALIGLAFTLDVCYSWSSMSSGGMSGVTYASGTIYNTNTMCPSNVNQGYVCDGRNFGDKYLDASKMSAFCSGHTGSSRQFGFGHGVTASQACGECAQIRVPRTDGTYNYMTVMMVDHFTWSMEVGTTEIAYLVDNTQWVVGDRADFEYRIVGDYDCYAAFDGNTQPTTSTTPTPISSGSGSCGGSTRCGATWSDANAKCGECCTNDGGCTTAGSSHCYADLAMSPCNTDTTPSSTSSTSTSTSSTVSGSVPTVKTSYPYFVSYVGQIGPNWGNAYNADLLSNLGVPGYSDHPYNVLNFAFWFSSTGKGAAATATGCWENLNLYITDSTLRRTLTGSSNPSSAALRAAIKAIYVANNMKIFVSAFGATDHPQSAGYAATDVGADLGSYAISYLYDGVDIDWEEGSYFNAAGAGEAWLSTLTATLSNVLNPTQKRYYITHAPQAPYFMGSTLNQYVRGGYLTVHSNVGHLIDWYNVQFYNQGSSTYNTFANMFRTSVGWSANSAVYQLINGHNPETVSIAANKIVVGKHSAGDGSDFVDGVTLRNIFNQALAANSPVWNTGFMCWQFYTENTQSPQFQVGNAVVAADWDRDATTPSTTSSTSTSTTTSTSTSTTTSTSSGTGGCGVSSNWGAMKITPWWGSSTSSMYAMITGSPATITSFEIRGSNQNNNEFQSCVYQNSNAFQCSISGGALTEPASVKLNGGAYYGIDIIASMTGSSAMYPLSACMGRATMEMDEDGATNNVRWPWTVWFVIVAMVLVFICFVVGIAIYFKKKKQGKGRKFETDGLQLRDNDGCNDKGMETKKAFEIIDANAIEDEGDDETEIEIEIEVDVEVENDGRLVTN